MGIDERIQLIKENTYKSYNAGQLSLLKETECLNGLKSGSFVTIDDISPIEHDVGVKVASKNLLSVNNAEVTINRYGKNLFKFDKSKSECFSCANATVVEKLDNGVVISGSGTGGNNQWASGWYSPYTGKENINMYFKKGQVVTISADYTFTNTDNLKDNTFGIYFNSTNGINLSNSYMAIYEELNVKKRITQKHTITKDGYYAPIFSINSCTIKIENIQVSLLSDNEYEPYKEPITYTPNEDGTVEGVTSLYPNMTLTTDTDGVIIDCEYYRDIDNYIDNLITDVALTGGD